MFMLETKAVFKRKDIEIEPVDCVVEKVIRLSGSEFDRFSRNLMRDWDFLRDNPIERKYDDEGRRLCLLVTGEGRRDGILVDAEGGSYARFSAFMPNAEDFLNASQSPALAALVNKLTGMANHIAEIAGTGNLEGRGVVNLQDDGISAGIDFMANGMLRSTLIAMLNEKPEIRDCEFDGNRLIVWRELGGDALTAEDISAPSVTFTDLYAYGYASAGMVPLGKERVLELFDKGHEVFLLYEDDTEGMVDSREEIETFHAVGGIFGIEGPTPAVGSDLSIDVFILNHERHKKGAGEHSGEWLSLPADADTLCGLLERIGIGADGIPSEDAFKMTAVRMPLHDYLRYHINKHDSIDELNMLASYIGGMEEHELNKLQAILSIGASYAGNGTAAIINLLDTNNFGNFIMIDAASFEALGRHFEEHKPEGVSLEEFGRQTAEEQKGSFTQWGYLYQKNKVTYLDYDGVVPDEYKIVGAALGGLQSKKPEHGLNEKPSVLEEIQASRRSYRDPKGKPKEKDIQKTKKNKGEADL